MLRFVSNRPPDAQLTWGQKAQIILCPILGSFGCSLFIVLVCIFVSAVLRPGSIHTNETAHVEERNWNGYCDNCDNQNKYAMVCDGSKSIWSRLELNPKLYRKEEPPSLDLELWCSFDRLSKLMRGPHAAIWPWLFAILFVVAAVVYDVNADDAEKAGLIGQAMRTSTTIAVYMTTLFVIWAFTEAADDSPYDTSATVVYTFSMVALSLQVPWRVVSEHGSFLKQSSSVRIVLFWLMWLPSFTYTLLLVLALGMTGRVFHTVGHLFEGLAWCCLLVAVIVVVHIIPIDLLFAKKDALIEEPAPEPDHARDQVDELGNFVPVNEIGNAAEEPEEDVALEVVEDPVIEEEVVPVEFDETPSIPDDDNQANNVPKAEAKRALGIGEIDLEVEGFEVAI